MLVRKRVLITGSSQGIGLETAWAFATADAQVMLTSERKLSELSDVQQLLKRFPICAYLQADLTAEGAADYIVDQSWQQFGGIDVLINNAGTFREPDFLKLTKSDFDFIFHLNVWSAVALSRRTAERMISNRIRGRILFTTSLNATRSEPGHTLYDASKGAINSIVRQLAIELAPHGITTAAIAPGLVETPLTDFGLRSDPQARNAILEQIPIGRIATPAEIAHWFVFLASDLAGYATGTIIGVDGGLDAQQMPMRPISHAERQSGV